MNREDKIAALERRIKQLESKKPKGSLKQKIKVSAKSLKESSKLVFSQLGKAADQVMGDFDSVEDAMRRMPQ